MQRFFVRAAFAIPVLLIAAFTAEAEDRTTAPLELPGLSASANDAESGGNPVQLYFFVEDIPGDFEIPDIGGLWHRAAGWEHGVAQKLQASGGRELTVESFDVRITARLNWRAAEFFARSLQQTQWDIKLALVWDDSGTRYVRRLVELDRARIASIDAQIGEFDDDGVLYAITVSPFRSILYRSTIDDGDQGPRTTEFCWDLVRRGPCN